MDRYDVDYFKLTIEATCPFCAKTVTYDATNSIEADLESEEDGWGGVSERAVVVYPPPPGWVRRQFQVGPFTVWKYSCAPDCEKPTVPEWVRVGAELQFGSSRSLVTVEAIAPDTTVTLRYESGTSRRVSVDYVVRKYKPVGTKR